MKAYLSPKGPYTKSTQKKPKEIEVAFYDKNSRFWCILDGLWRDLHYGYVYANEGCTELLFKSNPKECSQLPFCPEHIQEFDNACYVGVNSKPKKKERFKR